MQAVSDRAKLIEVMVNYARAVASWAGLFLRKPMNKTFNQALWVVYHDRHLKKLYEIYEESN